MRIPGIFIDHNLYTKCIIRCMRTNIDLNDDLLAEVRKYSKSKNKRAIVEEALTAYVALKAEERRLLTYKERLDRLRDRTRSVPMSRGIPGISCARTGRRFPFCSGIGIG